MPSNLADKNSEAAFFFLTFPRNRTSTRENLANTREKMKTKKEPARVSRNRRARIFRTLIAYYTTYTTYNHQLAARDSVLKHWYLLEWTVSWSPIFRHHHHRRRRACRFVRSSVCQGLSTSFFFLASMDLYSSVCVYGSLLRAGAEHAIK